MNRIPVILDTDIGSDIDDTWALAMLLKRPELDLKLVTTCSGDTSFRARICAKLLETAGRTDVPVGVGIRGEDRPIGQAKYVAGYELPDYPGTIHEDGVQAIVDAVMSSPDRVTLVAIGPLTNIAAALEREPRVAEKARFVGMHGSVRRGYNGSPRIDAEYNVREDIPACRRAFSAPWDKTVTPVDTCGLVRIKGEKYAAVCGSEDPMTHAVIENYIYWGESGTYATHEMGESSVLFDTVAVYLAFADELCEMERLGIRVTDDGLTVEDSDGAMMNVATAWKDLAAFEDLVVGSLT